MEINFDLEPLVKRIVTETVAQLRADESKLGDELRTYTEPQAAEILNMTAWQLRDERRDGRIMGSVARGGKIIYSQADLLAYLERRRWPVKK